MNNLTQIVSGGGWKGTRVVRVKARAWILFLVAVGLGCVSVSTVGTFWFHAWIPAALCLIVSLVLFIRERPLEFRWFRGRVGQDRGKLYGNFGGK